MNEVNLMHAEKSKITDIEKSRLDVLLKEYEVTNSKIEKFVGNQFLYTQGGLVLTGGYILFLVQTNLVIETATSGNDANVYLQFLPFIVLIILSGILYQYQRTIVLHGYKQYIEYAINKIVGKNLISYGHIGVKRMLQKNRIAMMNTSFYVLVYIAACVFSRVNLGENGSGWWLVSHISVFVGFLVLAWLGLIGCTWKPNLARRATQIRDIAIEKHDSKEMLGN